jgi:hypothetical protein
MRICMPAMAAWSIGIRRTVSQATVVRTNSAAYVVASTRETTIVDGEVYTGRAFPDAAPSHAFTA